MRGSHIPRSGGNSQVAEVRLLILSTGEVMFRFVTVLCLICEVVIFLVVVVIDKLRS